MSMSMSMSPRESDLVAGYSLLPASEATEVGDGGAASEEEDGLVDLFDLLPDSVLLLVFNKIGDVKALGRCCVVSRRFHALVPQVDNVLVRVDCVISDDDHNLPASSSSSSSSADASSCSSDKTRGLLSHLARFVLGGIVRPLQAIGQILAPHSPSDAYKRLSSSPPPIAAVPSSDISHHSPTEVLRNFKEIRRLRIELPTGELGVEDGVLLKWKAAFGSTLDSCVILGASSVLPSSSAAVAATSPMAGSTDKSTDGGEGSCRDVAGSGGGEDNGSIPESFYTNGSLKLRVVWTISSLIAASARHYLLQPIIAEHETLERLDLTDGDGQGVLEMGRGQLEELRSKPVSASGVSQRTLVPALNMRLWYAQQLEVSGGMVLKGATLVAIRPSEVSVAGQDITWVSTAFEEPYGSAVRQLVKRRMYCLEMNSF